MRKQLFLRARNKTHHVPSPTHTEHESCSTEQTQPVQGRTENTQNHFRALADPYTTGDDFISPSCFFFFSRRVNFALETMSGKGHHTDTAHDPAHTRPQHAVCSAPVRSRTRARQPLPEQCAQLPAPAFSSQAPVAISHCTPPTCWETGAYATSARAAPLASSLLPLCLPHLSLGKLH